MQPDNEVVTRLLRIIRAKRNGMTITEISRKIGMNRNSVAKYLDIMLISGQVEMEIIGSAKVFKISQRIPLASVMSCSPEFIIILDTDGKIQYINDRYLDFFRISKEDFISENITDIFLPILSSTDHLALITDALNGKSSSKEILFRHEGEVLHFRLKLIPSVLEGGKQGLTIILEDFTSEKISEIALRRSERTARDLLNTSPDLAFLLDKNGKIIGLNDNALQAVNTRPDEPLLTPDDIIGKHSSDLSVFAGDYEKWRRYFDEVARSAEEICFEEHSDGCWFDNRIHPVCDIEDGVISIAVFRRDITRQKNIENKLITNNRELSDIIEYFPDSAFVIDAEKKVTAWNRAIEKLTGVPKDEIIGKGGGAYSIPFYGRKQDTLVDLLDADESTISEIYPGSRRNGDSISAETYSPLLNSGNGAYLWVKGSSIYDQEGNIVGGIETIRDITDLKNAEKALKESEERFRAIFEDSPIGIELYDKNGNLSHANISSGEIFGVVVPSEIQGYNLFESASLTSEQINRLREGKPVWTISEVDFDEIKQKGLYKCRNSGSAFLDLFITPINHPGTEERLCYLMQLQDITEETVAQQKLKESEKRYRWIVEGHNELICRFREDGTLNFANGTFCRYFDLQNEKYAGISLFSLIEDSGRERLCEDLSKISSENPLCVSEFSFHIPDSNNNRDEKPVHHSWSISAITDENEDIIEYQAIGCDITRRKNDCREAIADADTKEVLSVEKPAGNNNDTYLKFLSGSAAELAGFPESENLYEYIGNQLNVLFPESVILVNAWVHGSAGCIVRSYNGISENRNDRSLQGMNFTIPDFAISELKKGALFPLKGEAEVSLLRSLTDIGETGLKNLSSANTCHMIGIVNNNRLAGCIIMFNPDDPGENVRTTTEAFVQQAAVLLQKRQIESSLYREYEERESRIQERTRELFDANENLQLEITRKNYAERSLKYALENFRQCFNILDVPAMIIGTEYQIIMINKKADLFFGNSEGEIDGEILEKYLTKNDFFRIQNIHENIFSGNSGPYSIILSQKQDGTENRRIRWQIEGLKNEKNKINSIVWMGRPLYEKHK